MFCKMIIMICILFFILIGHHEFNICCNKRCISNNTQACFNKQAKPETVSKVMDIVKKQLALDDSIPLTSESKFSELGADSLDTVF
jgi:hypothetical protein